MEEIIFFSFLKNGRIFFIDKRNRAVSFFFSLGKKLIFPSLEKEVKLSFKKREIFFFFKKKNWTCGLTWKLLLCSIFQFEPILPVWRNQMRIVEYESKFDFEGIKFGSWNPNRSRIKILVEISISEISKIFTLIGTLYNFSRQF